MKREGNAKLKSHSRVSFKEKKKISKNTIKNFDSVVNPSQNLLKMSERNFGIQRKKHNGNIRKLPKTVKPDDDNESNYVSNKSRDLSCVKNLLVKPEQRWFEQLPPDTDTVPSSASNVTPALKLEAQSIHKEDIQHYQKFLEKRKERSDFIWMQTILRTGTLPDKISAHTLLIQDSPVHNLSSIENLVSMVNPKGKRECLMAMDCLKDLFISDLLIEGKKLKSFTQHSSEKLDELAIGGSLIAKKKRLVLWYFEDQLKTIYIKFLKNLQLVSHDLVEKTKQKSVTVMYELLKNNPEQEQYLLENLVNKIGDPIAKVGSHVCHLLGQLVEHHPSMMPIVVQEVERVLFRTNIAERAKYYCLCFLNQLILCHEYSNVANHLISIYFGEFKMCVKKGEVNSKMMGALLSGVARAYPYTKLKNNIIMDQLDAMYHLVHMVSFNISIQALMLIFQVLDSKDSVSDRFYSALYRKLLDPAISTSSRQSMLLNLLYKALKKDIARARVKAFVKRLMQVSLYQAPNLQCGILLLISELAKTHSALFESQPAFMYSDTDEDEHFEDASDEDVTSGPVSKSKCLKKSKPKIELTEVPNTSSWVHRQDQSKSTEKFYNPQNRNPLHSGAEYCNLWELQYLKNCFHPSVAFFAGQISNSHHINYNSDPLQDFTTIKFLDRFVYRNPKKKDETTKADAHRKIFGGRKLHMTSGLQHVPITSDEYINQNEDQVPVEEKFIYQYLQKRSADSKKIKGTADSDIESVNSEEFETLLNAIHPEDEGKGTLDFAKELTSFKQKQKNTRRTNEEDNEDVDMESLDSDFEEIDFENDEEFQNAFDDEIDLDSQCDDISSKDLADFCENEFSNQSKKQKFATKKVKKHQKFDSEDLFASADQFATFLEGNADFKADTTTSEAFMNSDKAAAKQLSWENERDQYVRGVDWKSRRSNRFKKLNKKGKRRIVK